MANQPNTPDTTTKTVDNGQSDLDQIKSAITPEVAKVATKPKIEIGETVLVTPVHGEMEHPFTLDKFAIGQLKKVTVDAWIKLQYDSDKLTLAD